MSNCTHCDPKVSDWDSENLYSWCTGCGNYAIAAAMKRALSAEALTPRDVLLCFDIGCHGNGSDKIAGYRFHGLHGRVLPFAAGAAISNQRLQVIASGGDGGTLSEGVNHLVHTVRNNYNFTFLLHNNANYALTTGQASATTPKDVAMNASPEGPQVPPLNVCELVLTLGGSFVARAYASDVHQLAAILQAGMAHRGFSFIEVLQDCPTYNKSMPHDWYLERVFDVTKESDYDPQSRATALTTCRDLQGRIATGILYQDLDSTPFLEHLPQRHGVQTELIDEVFAYDASNLIARFR